MMLPGPPVFTPPSRTLFVASTGGHLAELIRLAPRLRLRGRPLWVTFDSPQSRSLLSGEEVIFVRFTAPRDFRNVLRNLRAATRVFNEHNIVEVVSTGSAIALSFLPIARSRGIRCHYLESAARTDGPSATGRLLSTIPGIQLYTAYEGWATKKWTHGISVFDSFVPGPAHNCVPDDLLVVVTLGTLPYRFDRLVDAVRAAILPSWDVVWQIGPNDYRDLNGEVHRIIESSEFDALCERADVVISHAGVGSALTALESGHHPILVPRLVDLVEHVDDHQWLVADALSAAGVASTVEPGEITASAIKIAARRSVRRLKGPRELALSR